MDIGRIAFVALALLPPAVSAWVLWGAPIDGLAADRTALAARDFTALWQAGHLALAHATGTLFDPEGFTASLRAEFGAGLPDQIWPYPPTALLLAAPLSLLPLATAFCAWTIGTAALLPVALRSSGLPRATAAAILLSPAVVTNALAGQNGALTASLLVGGLALLERRPVFAGALLGLLVVKPQLGLLLPLCLAAKQQWRALATSALTAIGLALLAWAAFGSEAWIDYALRTRPALSAQLAAPWEDRPANLIFASAFMAARCLGSNLAGAVTAQVAVTLACAWLAWRTWRAPGPLTSRSLALTLVLSLAASPWTHGYDMPALAAAVLLLLSSVRRNGSSTLGVAWTWPGCLAHLPFPPFLAMVGLGSMAWLSARLAADPLEAAP